MKKNVKLIDGTSQIDWTELSPLLGSRQEFDRLVEKHYVRMLSVADGICPPEWRVSSPHVAGFTAPDVWHEVFEHLANKWQYVPAEPGFQPYVSCCIRKRVSDILKKNNNRTQLITTSAGDYNGSACVGERTYYEK